MTWKEYLEDYQARELESWQHHFASARSAEALIRDAYPPKERFRHYSGPLAEGPGCVAWGVLPLQGGTIVSLHPTLNRDEFDRVHHTLGFRAENLNEIMQFAVESHLLGFGLAGWPTSFAQDEFLEPLFSTFEPPMLGGLPPDSFTTQAAFDAEKKAFLSLRSFGMEGAVGSFFSGDFTPKDPNSPLAREILEQYSHVYAFLRTSGFEDLAEEIERAVFEDSWSAVALLMLYQSLLVNPLLAGPGWDRILNRAPLRSAALRAAGVDGSNSILRELGRIFLSTFVPFPQTPVGSLRLLDDFRDIGLPQIRDVLKIGLRRNDAEIVLDAKKALELIVGELWTGEEPIALFHRFEAKPASWALAVTGPTASSITGAGLMASLRNAKYPDSWTPPNDRGPISHSQLRALRHSQLVGLIDTELE